MPSKPHGHWSICLHRSIGRIQHSDINGINWISTEYQGLLYTGYHELSLLGIFQWFCPPRWPSIAKIFAWMVKVLSRFAGVCSSGTEGYALTAFSCCAGFPVDPNSADGRTAESEPVTDRYFVEFRAVLRVFFVVLDPLRARGRPSSHQQRRCPPLDAGHWGCDQQLARGRPARRMLYLSRSETRRDATLRPQFLFALSGAMVSLYMLSIWKCLKHLRLRMLLVRSTGIGLSLDYFHPFFFVC